MPSILDRISGVFGGKKKQGTLDNQITNQMVARGRLPANQAEIYSQASRPIGIQQRVQPRGIPIGQPRGPAEDDALVAGPQGLVPMHADIAGLYGNEDIGQGEGTMNGFATSYLQPNTPNNFQLQAPRTTWQNTDLRRRNGVNPQVEDNGYYYF